MRHTTISGHHRAHDAEGAVFWIFAAVIVVIAFSEVVTLLAVAFAIVAAAWWLSRHLERRGARNDLRMAPVTHLLPAPPVHDDVNHPSAA